MLVTLPKWTKLYSFVDIDKLIDDTNIVAVASAINDLKLSIFYVRNGADFTSQNIISV